MCFGHLKEKSVGVSLLLPFLSPPPPLLLESSPSIDLGSDKKSMLHAAMGRAIAEANRRTKSRGSTNRVLALAKLSRSRYQ